MDLIKTISIGAQVALLTLVFSASVNAKDKVQTAQDVKSVTQAKVNTKSQADAININTANVAQLQQLSGIGESKAKAIVDYRKQIGKFTSISQLLNVKGIGEKLLEKNAAKLTL